MCELCHQTPCNPLCPNSPEPPVVYHCVQCGASIYAGDDFYLIDGQEWCEDCIEQCKKCAEPPDEDYW